MNDLLRPLINAIKSGNIDKVQETFRNDLFNKCDNSGRTGLHWACMFTNVEIVRFFLDKGWNIKDEDMNMDRPIHYAAICGSVSIVQELINRGCLLDVHNNDGCTPLDLSMIYNARECLGILREAMETQSSRVTDDNYEEFISAINYDNIDDVKRLFRSEYIHKIDGDGRTALYYACMRDNIDIVRYLLDNGWNIECEDNNKFRPIHIVARYGYISIVNELINRGCLFDVLDVNGFTPLDAAMINNHKKCAEIFRGKRQSLRGTDDNYDEFISAIKGGNIDDVTKLFRSEYINKGGLSALHYACWFNNIDIVRYLLDKGWNTESVDNNNNRPLHVAALRGRLSMVKELISRGCLLDVLNNLRLTPIDTAMSNNHKRCVEIIRKKIKNIDKVMTSAIKIIKNNKGELLGRGGYGQVYKYVHKDFIYAVKRVFIDSNNKEVKDINKEIDMYKSLSSHSRIVRYFGTKCDETEMYVFMEFATKGSIEQYLQKHGALPHDTIARYTTQILEGIQFLHRNNIIHGDIKGANLLIDSQDNIKICDFGISRRMATISNSSTVCGSPYWMAPEVINSEPFGVSADIWSVGASVVEMLTGVHPYPSLTPVQAMFKIGSTRTIEYEPVNPISAEFQSFLDQMLVCVPDKRADISTLLKSKFINTVSATSN